MGEKLKIARKNSKLKQSELATLIGVANTTISGWENGVSRPDVDMIELLCGALNISPNFFFDFSENTTKFTILEINLIHNYRALDKYGKEMANNVIRLELKRLEEETEIKERKIKERKAKEMQEAQAKLAEIKKQAPKPIVHKPYIEEAPTFDTTYFDDLPASAGDGTYSMDLAHSVVVSLKYQPPRGTSYIIRVSGDSMEPTLDDGDKVFIKAQPALDIGEIGVFVVDSSIYIKEYGGEKGLLSHNPNYDDIRLTEFSEFKCLGKYLGTCEEEIR